MGWKRSLRFQTRFKLIFEYREVMTKEFHQLERSGDDCKSNEIFFLVACRCWLLSVFSELRGSSTWAPLYS